jgi:hypothetical protein
MFKAQSPFSSARQASNNLTTASVPARSSRRVAGTCVSLCALRNGLLRRPVELGPVDAHAAQNDRELACNGMIGPPLDAVEICVEVEEARTVCSS